MRNAVSAERIIACLIGRAKAAVVVGDLLESLGEQETFAFWLSVTRIVLSLSWRPIVAFTAAVLSGYFLQRLSWHAYHPIGGIRLQGDVNRLGLTILLVALALQWGCIGRLIDTHNIAPRERASRRRVVGSLGFLLAFGWLIANYDLLYHLGFLYRGAAFTWFLLMTRPFLSSFRDARAVASSGK
jgi:hypothetical protein